MSEPAQRRIAEDRDSEPQLLAVPPERLYQDWAAARTRALRYCEALGLEPEQAKNLADAAVRRAIERPEWPPGSTAIRETLRALREIVVERWPPPADSFPALPDELRWRLERWLGSAERTRVPLRNGYPTSHQALRRRHMRPEPVERRFWRRVWQRLRGQRTEQVLRGRELRKQRSALPWIRAARVRRVFLALLVLLPTVVASGFMQAVLPYQGRTWLEFFIVLFFGALFGWISIGFWTALFGFFTLLLGDRYAITRLPPVDRSQFRPRGRTAIVMPICEEPVERVFAGLRAIYDSVERTGLGQYFDFFVLSDSADPGTWVKEEEAWLRWCRDVSGFGRVFYRRRRVRLKRKSGNVADFCRRWGAHYEYMIMLDADSIMSGDTIVRLVQLMDANPQAGMIQTAPRAVNRRSLLARVQQFSSRLYGPMFAAGLHFWQLGDGQYWGHNTIIRVEPFTRHCGLPRLPGKPPLGGEIMSHDFVEAALLGRAGWQIWLAYDLDGSYEEVPSTLLEEMNRDRRWCQGNLQHLRLLFTEGLFGAHRVLFLNGVLSYVSALLWFAFLALSTVEAVSHVIWEPEYFPHGPSLFPEWPIWRPEWAVALMGVTAAILFLPKLLSVLLVTVVWRQAGAFGGAVRLIVSVLLEILLSSLFAPIRMVFHSRFVVQNLLGRTVQWKSQGREDAETTWADALRHHAWDSLWASAWGLGLYWLNPGYFWWLTPIIAALILAVPLSVWVSRVRWGDRARRLGLFLIPEEVQPPSELVALEQHWQRLMRESAKLPNAEREGFVRGVVDPFMNAWHRALLGGPRRLRESVRARRREWMEKVLEAGPQALPPRERRYLMYDPEVVAALHESVWSLEEESLLTAWGRPAALPAAGAASRPQR
ncbi:MAG: glucans biosynthesis glucosyltransferase H [Candidatus Binatia bacterium]|nr:MAG: glucans biosynthesis glucosyltransferase H [Candidatus Binatia bacterium]